MASRMLNDADIDREERLTEVTDLEVLSPELEELLDWFEGAQRSVQEVADQLRLLADDERDRVGAHLELSPRYGMDFLDALKAHDTRFDHRKSRLKKDTMAYRRDVPEGFQKVLVNINRLQSLGRNVLALTPEMLPEDLLRLWPSGKPHPELVIINLDLEVPRVSVVRRLPSAGGIKIERGALKSMTSVVAKVLGQPAALRKVAAREGLTVDHAFEKVDVDLTEIAWSPQLELGELLFDWEEIKSDDEAKEEQHELDAARGSLEAGHTRLHHNAELVEDLSVRLDAAQGGWADLGGKEADEALQRLRALQEQREGAQGRLGELEAQYALISEELQAGGGSETEARLAEFEARMGEMEEETAQLSEQVTEEERALAEHRQALEEQAAPRLTDVAAEEPESDERRVEKALEEPTRRGKDA